MKNAVFARHAAVALSVLVTAGAASAQTAAPMPGDPAASAPLTREQVKRERDAAAAKENTVPKGDPGSTKNRMTGSPAAKAPAGEGATRAEVKAEARRAIKAGEVPRGEGSEPKHPPVATGPAKTRAEVKAEARAAARNPVMPKGDEGSTVNAPKL